MPRLTQRHVAPTVAVTVALSAGGIGMAYGSMQRALPVAKQAARKRNHVLSADYKTEPVQVGNVTQNTVQFFDDAKLVGRPFGNRKAHLSEVSLATYNQPQPNPAGDFSGTQHTTFKAEFFTPGVGGFHGSYDQTLDVNGQATGPINGTITGGSGTFRGAKGSFQILNLTAFHPENVQYMGHWQGSIRY